MRDTETCTYTHTAFQQYATQYWRICQLWTTCYTYCVTLICYCHFIFHFVHRIWYDAEAVEQSNKSLILTQKHTGTHSGIKEEYFGNRTCVHHAWPLHCTSCTKWPNWTNGWIELDYLPVMLMITSTEFCFSRSSSCRKRTRPVSRSTLKTGPDMLYRTLPPSGSVAGNETKTIKWMHLSRIPCYTYNWIAHHMGE